MRHRFGFTDPALTAGALGSSCTRCDGAAIDTCVTSILAELDLDGDGTVGALTDGLIVLRFAFGFRGSLLVSGAVGENCTRCDAESIVPLVVPLFA
jgi:hypothetical protein